MKDTSKQGSLNLDSVESINSELCFARFSDVSPDSERSGLLRSKTYPIDANPSEVFEFQTCPIYDLSTAAAPDLNLEKMGFDCIDLSADAGLQSLFEQVRRSNFLTKPVAKAIRQKLWGKAFNLSNGKRMRLLYIAPEGFIIRKSGPNGLMVNPGEEVTEMNGHEAAALVHGDQDVYGTPVKQILKGMAPRLFRHQTPDGKNTKSPIFLLNIWIPLQQIVRPLVLMDRSTLNKQKHQLRLSIPTDSFLKRGEDQKMNDSWTFLPDKEQKWYFNSALDAKNAYVFDTLGEPHGTTILPGEELAEQYYLSLKQATEAIVNKDENVLKSATNIQPLALPVDTTLSLQNAINMMLALINEAHESNTHVLAQTDWVKRAGMAMDSVVRKSIEMRTVAWVS